jgi:S1-C subfamily serine protease
LASKQFAILRPPREGEKTSPGSDQPSMVWSGTGFFISNDGLVLTNRHVAKGAKTLLVTMGDKQSSADVVAIDDLYDLALIRIKSKDKTPFAHFSPLDLPSDGADCVVMGFPLIDRLGADVKITRGVVSSSASDDGFGADILTDAKVNPGNSGGPILDKHGNVMAIVCMKSVASAMEDSYGIGISAGHIREFLKRNKIAVDPGTADQTMSTEDIVAQIKPATVCILATK